MVKVNVNSHFSKNRGGGQKQYNPHLSFSVSTRICYELDREYFIKKVSNYRKANLQKVKLNQKIWYENKAETIRKREEKAKIRDPIKYKKNKQSYQRNKEWHLRYYQKQKYKKVMKELLNPKEFIPKSKREKYKLVQKKTQTIYFN